MVVGPGGCRNLLICWAISFVRLGGFTKSHPVSAGGTPWNGKDAALLQFLIFTGMFVTPGNEFPKGTAFCTPLFFFFLAPL